MDDLPKNTSGRGAGEDVFDQLSQGDSHNSDTELKNLADYSIPDDLKVKPVLPLQEREHDSFQCTQSSTFTPTSQLPPTMQRQVPLQYQADVDDDEDGLTEPLDLTMSGKYKGMINVQAVPARNREQSHDTPFSRDKVISTKALQSRQQDRDFMYRIQQNPQLQTDQAAYIMPREKLSSEAFVHKVSETTASQQQYQHIQEEPRHQQVRVQVTSPHSRSPLLRSLLHMEAPTPLMPTLAQKPPSQMTLGHQSTERNTEEMKKMEEIQQSALNFKKQTTYFDSGMHGDHPSAVSNSTSGKDTDDKTSDEARHDSDKSDNISRVPQPIEPNQGRLKEEEEEMHELAERIKKRRIELALSQQDVRVELNYLSRKHNLGEDLQYNYIYNIERKKISVNRMLQLKPLLELWLESTEKRYRLDP